MELNASTTGEEVLLLKIGFALNPRRAVMTVRALMALNIAVAISVATFR